MSISCNYILFDSVLEGQISRLLTEEFSLTIFSHMTDAVKKIIRPDIFVLCRAVEHDIEWVSKITKVKNHKQFEVILSIPNEFFYAN